MKKIILVAAMVISNITFAQITIINQNFETGVLPPLWTRTQTVPSVGWEFGTTLGSTYFPIPAHTGYAASNDDAHDDNSAALNVANMDRLITPTMNLTAYAGSGVVVTFDYIQPGTYGSVGTVEVTTNGGALWTPVATVGTSATWTSTLVNISAYTSSATVKVGFRHNDNGAWADGFGIDNVIIKSVPAYDVAATAVTLNNYVAAGNTTITGTVTNMGYNTITSLSVSYSVDGGAAIGQTFNGLNIPLGSTDSISFTTPANLSIGMHDICITTGNINGTADLNSGNNHVCKTVEVISSIPVKKTLLERHTGSWGQFCPDGDVVASLIDSTQTNTICVSIHNADAMDIPDGNLISTEYISGYPSGTIDRKAYNAAVEQNRGNWEAICIQRNADIVPLGVSILDQDWNSATREITVTVGADFVGSLTGDLRFNVFIVEDQVTGVGVGYDQVNYYNTVVGHPYYGAGNPIVGYMHKKVVREMLGGAWGTGSIIPANVASGNNYSLTYTYTLPAGYDENKIYLVGLVQRYDAVDNANRMIYNAEEVQLYLGNAGIENENSFNKTIYPNPFSDQTRLEFELPSNSNVKVTVFDMTGKKVNCLVDGFMNQGSHSAVWYGDYSNGTKVPNGEYIITLDVNGDVSTSKVILSK